MIRIGRLVVDESEIRNISESVGSISFDGIESVANQSVMSVKRKQQDIVASAGMMVPVTFDHKPDYDGYYVVESAEAVLTNWHRQAVAACEWDLSLASVGSYNDIDLESRLGGPVTLPNLHGGTGERWHAPPPGHTAYWSASSAPTSITRTGSEGPIKVYRNVSDAVNTRWNCPPNLYPIGRARFTDANGFERTGASYKLTPTGWTISNSLMRVGAVPGSAHLMIEAFTQGNWQIGRAHV